MPHISFWALGLLGFLSPALGIANNGDSCRTGALSYLANRNGIPNSCISKISSQAKTFCSGYMIKTSAGLVTASRVATITVTKTETLKTTATQTLVSKTETTAIRVQTATTATATSTTTVTTFVPPQSLVPRVVNNYPCPDLPDKRLLSLFPANLVSSACKCLGVTPTLLVALFTTTQTSTSTASATSKTTTTTTITITTVSSSTTTSTTTVSAVATETVTIDFCSVSYNPSGNGIGNTILTPPGVSTAFDCCVLCWNTINCVASAFPSGCQLLVKTEMLDGAPTSDICPLGSEGYNFPRGPGVVYSGPCAVPPVP